MNKQTRPKLPEDPRDDNPVQSSLRAAFKMLEQYEDAVSLKNDDLETVLAYVIANFAHVADYFKVDFSEVLRKARRYYTCDFETSPGKPKGAW